MSINLTAELPVSGTHVWHLGQVVKSTLLTFPVIATIPNVGTRPWATFHPTTLKGYTSPKPLNYNSMKVGEYHPQQKTLVGKRGVAGHDGRVPAGLRFEHDESPGTIVHGVSTYMGVNVHGCQRKVAEV